MLLGEFGTQIEKLMQLENFDEIFEKVDVHNLEETLASNIATGARIKRLNIPDNTKDTPLTQEETALHLLGQYQVLKTLSELLTPAQELAEYIAASRAHTGNGGAGPTMIDNIMNQEKLDKHISNSMSKSGTLINSNVLTSYNPYYFDNKDALRETLRNAPLGYVQTFTALG